MKVVLAEKLFGIQPRDALDAITDLIRSEARGLDAAIRAATVRSSGLLEVEYSGRDEEIFGEILRRKIGPAALSVSILGKWDSLRGFVSKVDDQGFWIEPSVDEEKSFFLLWEKNVVNAQLEDGQELPLVHTARRYCLHRGFPLDFLILRVDTKNRTGRCQLSDRQHEKLLSWKALPLDRVIAIGVTKGEAGKAIEEAGLLRDIIQVQALSLSVQALICKLGTEAPGIIAKLGRFLPSSRLYAFNSGIKSSSSSIT